MKISVIMASYLKEYVDGPHQSANNREYKFIRAVDSFINQTYKNTELIIISDGCDKTEKIYNDIYKKYDNIKFIKLSKQEQFSGKVRQVGINIATGKLISYLDTDDIFGPNHLDIISKNCTDDYDWFYYNDFLFNGITRTLREVKPEHCFIGTSSFCHKSSLLLKWEDGYGHDWRTIEKILQYKNKKINTPEYLVCHCSGLKIDY